MAGIMVTGVRFQPHNVTIAGLTRTGGRVYRFTERVGDRARDRAERRAPVGQGTLRAGITGPYMQAGVQESIATVYSTAPHTLYVHEGTTGPIRRPGGGPMPIHSVTNRSLVQGYATSVRGQRANPFMWRALRSAVSRYRGR